MGKTICLLVTVLYASQGSLIRAAIELDREDIDPQLEDQLEWLGEPKALEMVHALLPLNVQSMGPVVEVEHIFSISTAGGSVDEAKV